VSQRSIEVKVGALILVALGLLGAFVVVMGGLSFEPTLTVYVTFQNPGGLRFRTRPYTRFAAIHV